MDGGWWLSSRLALSVFWGVVIQVVADLTGDPLPWWMVIVGGLLAGFLGTFALVFGYHVVTGTGGT